MSSIHHPLCMVCDKFRGGRRKETKWQKFNLLIIKNNKAGKVALLVNIFV
jgi:hypothetical protein